MILLARNSCRRWTTVTLLHIFERKRLSSIAVSPPPTTTTSRPLKKKPSQTAQALTPRPLRRSSFGSPRYFAFAPVAMMTERPSCIPSEVQTFSGRFEKSTFETFPSMLGFKRRRAPVRHTPDVRAPEGDPPLRRPGERSGERGADPPGALARRVESRRPTIAHAARVVDPRGRTRSPPSHAAAGRARPAPVPGPLQFQPAKAPIDDGPCRGRGEGDPRGAAGGNGARLSKGRPRSRGGEGRGAARSGRLGPGNRGRSALGHSRVTR